MLFQPSRSWRSETECANSWHCLQSFSVSARPGVFYAYSLSDPATIHHVGLYIGDGLMIEAPHTGAVVRIASINRSDYFGATRPA